MKKRFLILVLSVSILALIGGCSKKDTSKTPDKTKTEVTKGAEVTKSAETTNSTDTSTPKKGKYDLSKYIKLGKYKGIEVTVSKPEVTEDEINTQIKTELQNNATTKEIKDRAVKKGDIVNIDYEGLKDGKAFEGGTSKGFDLTIGSNQFIEGFEDKLIGAKSGEKKKLDLSFPENYGNKDLAGKAVVFNVTVNSIKVQVVPEVADYVKTKTKFKSIDEYKKSVKETLLEQKKSEIQSKKQNDILTAVIKDSKITYPKTLVEYYSAVYLNSAKQYATQFGTDLEGLIKAQGMTQEQFDAQVKNDAEMKTSLELALKSIIKAEKLKLTNQEYKDGVAKILKENNLTEEDLFKQVTKAELEENLLWQKTVDFITDNAIEK